LLVVAKFVKAFGIKGELVAEPMTDDLSRLGRLKRAFVGQKESAVQETSVSLVHREPRGVRLKLAGVDDRTAAERMVGAFLFVNEADAVHPPKGRYFIHDVVGLQVIDQQRGSIGTVTEVLKLPAHHVYVINTGTRDVMIPAVEEFVKEIDVKTGTMHVRLIEGMLEENAD